MMHARTCLRFGEISSLLVAFLMLIASSWSVLVVREQVSFDQQRNEKRKAFGGFIWVDQLGMLHTA